MLEFSRESRYYFRTYAVDQVGNTEAPKEDIFWVDVTDPTTSLSLQGTYEGNILSSNAEISLASSDNITGVKAIFYQFDQGEKRLYENPLAVRDMEEGIHELVFFAEDQVGNSETPRTYKFFYDKSPPEVEVSILGSHYQLENTIYVSGNSQIKIEASDNISGVSAIQFALDNGDEKTYISPFSLPLQSGLHTITCSMTDKVGNARKKMAQKIYVDISAPETFFDFSGLAFKDSETFVVDQPVTVTLRSADLESGLKDIKYSLNEGAIQSYATPILLSDPGMFRLAFFAEDHVSNVEKQRTLTIQVEPLSQPVGQSAPSPEIQPGGSKVWFDQNGQLIGPTGLPFYLRISTSPENSAESFLLDLGSSKPADASDLVFTRPGENTLRLSTKGMQTVVKVDIDGVPPVTKADFSGAEKFVNEGPTYYGPNLSIRLAASDSGGGVNSGVRGTYYAVGESGYVLYGAPLQNFSRERAYSLVYYSTDQVGNVEPAKQENFTVDVTPPHTRHTVEGEYLGHFLSPRTVVSLTANDNLSGVASTYFAFDQNEARAYPGKLTGDAFGNLKDGRHELHYFSHDKVGNIEDVHTFVFWFDKMPPSCDCYAKFLTR